MNDANFYAKFVDLSPFEIKDELMRLAQADSPRARPTSTPAAATRTGSPPAPARPSSCLASSR